MICIVKTAIQIQECDSLWPIASFCLFVSGFCQFCQGPKWRGPLKRHFHEQKWCRCGHFETERLPHRREGQRDSGVIGYKNTFTGLVCHFFVPLFSFLLYFSGVFVCSEMGAGPKKHTTEANQCKSMQKKEEDWSKTLRKVEPGAHHSLTVNSLKLEAFRSTIGECSIDGRRPRSFYRESTKINETLPMRSSSGPKFIS